MPPMMRPVAILLASVALAGCGAAEPEVEAKRPAPVQEAAEAPLPKMRPRVVQPQAGIAAPARQGHKRKLAVAPIEDDKDLPAPSAPASAGAAKPSGLTSGG